MRGNMTIQNSDGVEVYTAKAWVNFNGVAVTIAASGNISSVVDNGVGDYTLNFTNELNDALYSVSGIGSSPPTGSMALKIHSATNGAETSVVILG